MIDATKIDATKIDATKIDAYRRHLQRRGLKPTTCIIYLHTARRFLRHLGARSFDRITRGQVEAYLATRAVVLSPATHRDESYRVRAFLRALVFLGLLDDNAAERIKVKPAPYGLPLLLSEQAITSLLTAASGPPGAPTTLRDRALVELAYGVGLRASEIAAAKVAHLNLKEATILAQRAKNGGQALLPLPPSCVEHLRRYLRDGRPALVVLGRRRDHGHLLLNNVGTPLDRRRVSEIVTRIALLARRRAHPHALRRALATHLLAGGVSVTAVQALLGHARLDTTARYVAVDRDDLRRTVAILDRAT